MVIPSRWAALFARAAARAAVACPYWAGFPGWEHCLERAATARDALNCWFFCVRALSAQPMTAARSPRNCAKKSDRSGHRHGSAICREWQERRSEEHTSELQSLMRISYAVFCLKKKNNQPSYTINTLVLSHI